MSIRTYCMRASPAFPNDNIWPLGHCEFKFILPNSPEFLYPTEKLKCVLLFIDNFFLKVINFN